MCDFIQIEASKQTQSKIPFIILPHLLPDLPLYILWAEDPVQDNPISHEMEKWATRIIFDSEVTDNLPAFARTLLDHSPAIVKSPISIGDGWKAGAIFWPRHFIPPTAFKPSNKPKKSASPTTAMKLRFSAILRSKPSTSKHGLQRKSTGSFLKQKKTVSTTSSLTIELKEEKNPDLAPGTVISIDIFAFNGYPLCLLSRPFSSPPNQNPHLRP